MNGCRIITVILQVKDLDGLDAKDVQLQTSKTRLKGNQEPPYSDLSTRGERDRARTVSGS